jgi:hypothetical protein
MIEYQHIFFLLQQSLVRYTLLFQQIAPTLTNNKGQIIRLSDIYFYSDVRNNLVKQQRVKQIDL